MLKSRVLNCLLIFAVASLVLNDVARLSFPEVFQIAFVRTVNTQEDDENSNNNPTNTIFEEEVKHKDARERIETALLPLQEELDVQSAHLISDDEVRHLAFLPIFSPPPNRA
ncbi:MAG TPA: hypothetical protein PKL15_13715 [Saprospiraceae bacterium]|nr:hypothetical protein [Saprospiraceae bacterium]HNM26492.1 hypothetical protein [Saprospiraceae bacterium]